MELLIEEEGLGAGVVASDRGDGELFWKGLGDC